MTPEQKQEIRAAEVERSFWEFFVEHKNELSDCIANQQLMLAALEEHLAPVSTNNLNVVWAGLSLERKAQFAPPVGGLRYKPQVKSVEKILEKADTGTVATKVRTGNILPNGRPEMVTVAGVLPERFTPKSLKAMDLKTYKELISTYGSAAIDARLKGEN